MLKILILLSAEGTFTSNRQSLSPGKVVVAVKWELPISKEARFCPEKVEVE